VVPFLKHFDLLFGFGFDHVDVLKDQLQFGVGDCFYWGMLVVAVTVGAQFMGTRFCWCCGILFLLG